MQKGFSALLPGQQPGQFQDHRDQRRLAPVVGVAPLARNSQELCLW